MNKRTLGIMLLLTSVLTPCLGQIDDWKRLVPLESNRSDVEAVLGKPQQYFDTFGTYKTELGRFSVWYSFGGCNGADDGLQWRVAKGKMTRLLFYPKTIKPLATFLVDVKGYKREESPGGYSRYHYTSQDESIIYETIMRDDGSEFIYTIELQPNKDKQALLCGGDRKN